MGCVRAGVELLCRKQTNVRPFSICLALNYPGEGSGSESCSLLAASWSSSYLPLPNIQRPRCTAISLFLFKCVILAATNSLAVASNGRLLTWTLQRLFVQCLSCRKVTQSELVPGLRYRIKRRVEKNTSPQNDSPEHWWIIHNYLRRSRIATHTATWWEMAPGRGSEMRSQRREEARKNAQNREAHSGQTGFTSRQSINATEFCARIQKAPCVAPWMTGTDTRRANRPSRKGKKAKGFFLQAGISDDHLLTGFISCSKRILFKFLPLFALCTVWRRGTITSDRYRL